MLDAADVATRKRLTLVACILGSGIALLDGTVVNVALPRIQRALGGGLAAQQWVVNGYLLTLGSLILIGGSLGDLYGERRVFAIGVAGFGVASLACALAPSIGALVGRARAAGRRGRAARAELAGGDREHVPGVRARRGDRQLDGVGRDRRGARAAGRRRAARDRHRGGWIFLINIPLAAACVVLILIGDPQARAPRARAAAGSTCRARCCARSGSAGRCSR